MSLIKESPILFSGDMVRAILAGRKTQTRRVVKPQPPACAKIVYSQKAWHCFNENGDHLLQQCHHSWSHKSPGDRLWVKETFQPKQLASMVTGWRYRATDEKGLGPWKPSIFMPRAASRITLEIESVRVERLNQISKDDCFAEGSPAVVAKGIRTWYADLWESINGQGSWDKNPWVWVITFKPINQNGNKK